MVDREDITQMEAAASQGDKEDSTRAAMEVKEDKEVTTQVGVWVREAKEDIIQDRMEAMEVKEVTTQEVMATKEGKEVTTLMTMDSGAMVDKVDKEDTTQVGMATKEEARVVTIQEEVVTMMEMGAVVTILVDLWTRRGILEKRSIGRLSAQLSEVHCCFWSLYF